ncbi:MAG: protein kinase [Verrucomicrobia bacterium]|nr:protein kinase [Verrucomicrobiota bacterium]
MSNPDNLQETIFNAAITLPTAQRSGYLDFACAGNPELRRRVDSLLQAIERAGSFLDPGEDPIATSHSPFAAPAEEQPGEKIGRYKLLQKIGEGGCGIVYMAEQEEPVRRRVALKVIKLGMDTKAVIARFEAERQALARMEHPNIARVLDAGATTSGRPFFVMELVRGVRITDYCDQNNLTTEQRLQLFIKVCQAIQHAHQKGIIHRDIKPSNILVTLHDGQPVPKVIDFGIAKATQGRLTEQTLFTAFEQFIGTPAYVSPEQAEMSGLDIDTRSDIYSLGVLLYELLTGRTPFETQELLASGLDEMRRRIREKEPPRPSTRLRTLDDLDRTTVARRRGTDAPRLEFELRGDLDWIVMRCLEKDRSRRYETANGIAMDVERHLNNEPVTARPPSTTYLFAKLVRRHRLAFGAGLAITGILAAGLAVATILYLRERDSLERARQAERERATALAAALQQKNAAVQARIEAEAGRKKAQDEAARRAEVAALMLASLKDIAMNAALSPHQQVLRDLVGKAAELRRQFADQPRVLAAIDETLGGVFVKLDRFKEAEDLLLAALQLRKQAQGESAPEVAQTLNYLGHLYSRQSRWNDAYEQHTDALTRLEDRPPGDKPEAAHVLEIARTMSAIGWVRAQQGELNEALNFLRLALGKQRQYAALADVAATLIRIGSVLTHEGRVAEAEEALRESWRINETVFGAISPQVVSSLQSLAVTIAVTQIRLPEAIQLYRQAFEIRERINNPTSADEAREVSTPAAPPSLEEVMTKPGMLAEVEAALRDAQQYAVALYGRDSWEQAFYHALRAWVLLQEKRYVEAERLARECLTIRESLRPEDWSTHHARHMLGASLIGQGRRDEGMELLLLGYRGMKERAGNIPPFHKSRLGEAAWRIREIYASLGRVDEVTAWTAEFNSLDEEERKVLMARPAK